LHFTAHHDDSIDDHIRGHLELIKAHLIANIPSLVSLMLVGGFGRGEGSVIIEKGHINVLNDYDFILVTKDTCPPPEFLRQQANQLAKQSGVRFIDLIPIQLSELGSLPATQFNYDFKHGAKVIWGQNVIPLLPNYKPHHISIESAKTLLLNRMICLLESYSRSYEVVDPLKENRFFIYQQSQKVILSVAEALLISVGHYDTSYAKRAESFRTQFPDLSALHSLISIATSYKLCPSHSMWEQANVVHLWKEAVSVLLKTLALSFSGILDIGDPSQIQQVYLGMENRLAARSIAQHLAQRSEVSDGRPSDLVLRHIPALLHIRSLAYCAQDEAGGST
jgi:hypothetical protein